STTWLDDYLEYTFATAGEYTLEVTSWLYSTGLPVGVDYELQVSLENHAVSGFVFSPSPVLENESEQDGEHGQTIGQEDFYTFYQPRVGNTGAGCGTLCSVDWLTPSARIQGSGNGTYDLFSFEVTADMLDPTASDSQAETGSVRDTSAFYSNVVLGLNG